MALFESQTRRHMTSIYNAKIEIVLHYLSKFMFWVLKNNKNSGFTDFNISQLSPQPFYVLLLWLKTLHHLREAMSELVCLFL